MLDEHRSGIVDLTFSEVFEHINELMTGSVLLVLVLWFGLVWSGLLRSSLVWLCQSHVQPQSTEFCCVLFFALLCSALLSSTLAIDPFGNYLCQKLIEHCADQQRFAIIQKVAPVNFFSL